MSTSTEERLESLERELARAKRRSRWLAAAPPLAVLPILLSLPMLTFGQTTQPTSQPEAWAPTTQPDFETAEAFVATITPELEAEQSPGSGIGGVGPENRKWKAALKDKLFRCEGTFWHTVDRPAMGGHIVVMVWPATPRPIFVCLCQDAAFADQIKIAERGCPIVVEGIFSGTLGGPRPDDAPGRDYVSIFLRPSRIVSLGPK